MSKVDVFSNHLILFFSFLVAGCGKNAVPMPPFATIPPNPATGPDVYVVVGKFTGPITNGTFLNFEIQVTTNGQEPNQNGNPPTVPLNGVGVFYQWKRWVGAYNLPLPAAGWFQVFNSTLNNPPITAKKAAPILNTYGLAPNPPATADGMVVSSANAFPSSYSNNVTLTYAPAGVYELEAWTVPNPAGVGAPPPGQTPMRWPTENGAPWVIPGVFNLTVSITALGASSEVPVPWQITEAICSSCYLGTGNVVVQNPAANPGARSLTFSGITAGGSANAPIPQAMDLVGDPNVAGNGWRGGQVISVTVPTNISKFSVTYSGSVKEVPQ